MTRRERLEAVINGEITEELVADCKRELEKLNAHGAAVLEKTKESIHYKENKVYEDWVCNLLGAESEPIRIEELMDRLGVEMSRQRLTAICTNLIREGRIGSVDLKVKGKGKRKGYFLI